MAKYSGKKGKISSKFGQVDRRRDAEKETGKRRKHHAKLVVASASTS